MKINLIQPIELIFKNQSPFEGRCICGRETLVIKCQFCGANVCLKCIEYSLDHKTPKEQNQYLKQKGKDSIRGIFVEPYCMTLAQFNGQKDLE